MTIEPLTDEQLRVLGALIEKEATVPDTYPMTLKGLISACNQKNNREPVTDLDSFTVQRTLDELKALGLARFVYASHGARTTKYRHVFDEKHGVEQGEQAILAVLMLRGPNTVNELRTRTERYHPFESNDEVEDSLELLAGREVPLVQFLPTQPGQREARWTHLLGGAMADEPSASSVGIADEERPVEPTARRASDPEPVLSVSASQAAPEHDARVAALESRVAELERHVRYLMEELGVSPSNGSDTPPHDTEV